GSDGRDARLLDLCRDHREAGSRGIHQALGPGAPRYRRSLDWRLTPQGSSWCPRASLPWSSRSARPWLISGIRTSSAPLATGRRFATLEASGAATTIGAPPRPSLGWNRAAPA